VTENENSRFLPDGTVLNDRYRIDSVSSYGNFGITYVGWDLLLDSRVAVKEFFPLNRVGRNVACGSLDVNILHRENYKEALHNYLDEAKRLSKMNQIEAIVSIRDFFYGNKTAYIIMDFIEGVSVKNFIQENGPVSTEKMLEMLLPVMDALQEVHDRGIIHRDISPDNIMITKEGKVILVDFGSAKRFDTQDKQTFTVSIKRGYSSPELYRSAGEQGPWSDVYALAATMYFMLSGRVPDESIDRILDDEMPRLCELRKKAIPKGFCKTVMKGMALHQEERFESVKEFRQALQAVCRQKKPEEKWKTSINVALLSCLVVAVGAFFFHLGYGQRMRGLLDEGRSSVYTLPSVQGKNVKDAEEMIRGKKDQAVKLHWKEVYSDLVEEGVCMDQSVDEGTQYSTTSPITVTVTVSKGPNPQEDAD